MRNAFRTEDEGAFGFGPEFDPEYTKRSSSPDQLALAWASSGEVVAASPLPVNLSTAFQTDLAHFSSDFELGSAINKHRARDLGLPPISQSTRYLSVISDYSERTRILALDGERLSLPDADLLEWLINAEKQMTPGTDNHPVFENGLEDTACSIRRLPNGQISMTEVSRQNVQAMRARIRNVAGQNPPLSLAIETPLRCAARYFLTVTDAGVEIQRPGKTSEVTAFLLLNMTGYSFGLWSPQTGLFTENAFLAPDEISRQVDNTRSKFETAGAKAAPDNARITAYIRQAFDQLNLLMSSDKLEQLQLSNYVNVVWVAEQGLANLASPVAAEFASKTGYEFKALGVPVGEAVADGLLLGSYTFGEPGVIGAERLPVVDLAHDILALADTEESQRRREEEVRMASRRNKAVMTLMAAPVLAAAVLIALTASLFASYLFTSWRDSQADAKTLELKPALDRRKSYEANLKWYQEFISEVSQLRRQQPVGIGLLNQLNSNYPFNIDPTFYVSDMKLSQNGDVEMKGLARNKDAVVSFLKALEFAGGPESGTRLFSNLAYEVQEMAPPAVTGQVTLPTLSGSKLTTNTTAAPGVVQWRMTGNYAPVAEFAPKPVPAAAGQPTPVPGQKPAPVQGSPAAK